MKDPTVVRTYPDGKLYFRVTANGGEYAFIQNSKSLIEYYMLYEKQNLEYFGDSATQVKLWNRISPSGMTRYVFFDLMLGGKFSTMISDSVQSKDGRRFWISNLAEAMRRDFNIGMLDGKKFEKYDKNEAYDDWIARMDGWGREPKHRNKRFVITKFNC